VAATADRLAPRQRAALAGVRLLLSAGAPVPVSLLRTVSELLPGAELHTPYGMTEVLPVTDITLAEIERAGGASRGGTGNDSSGVCVGRPLPGVQVAVRPLDQLGQPDPTPTEKAGVTGEICVGAAHVKDRYDQLWATDQAAAAAAGTHPGWHRTGDVGHLDDDGRLWVEGRLVHLVTTAAGVVTPVGVEQRVQELPEVALAAAVGVGPVGTQALVVVVAPEQAQPAGLASPDLARAVRAAVGSVEVAAVLVVAALPVDIRHNSKIDRTRVAAWAARVLAGGSTKGRAGRP
jgi:olefin beta-lactone synthetase